MFANTIKNSVARHVLSRVHAYHLASEKQCRYTMAATVVEALNWCNGKMDWENISQKEHQCIHRLYTKMRKIKERNFRYMIYDDDSGIYHVRLPQSVVGTIWTNWRNKRK